MSQAIAPLGKFVLVYMLFISEVFFFMQSIEIGRFVNAISSSPFKINQKTIFIMFL